MTYFFRNFIQLYSWCANVYKYAHLHISQSVLTEEVSDNLTILIESSERPQGEYETHIAKSELLSVNAGTRQVGKKILTSHLELLLGGGSHQYFPAWYTVNHLKLVTSEAQFPSLPHSHLHTCQVDKYKCGNSTCLTERKTFWVSCLCIDPL